METSVFRFQSCSAYGLAVDIFDERSATPVAHVFEEIDNGNGTGGWHFRLEVELRPILRFGWRGSGPMPGIPESFFAISI